MNDEAIAYTTFAQSVPLNVFNVQGVRERSELIHQKINEKLLKTFKGTEEEKLIKISSGDSIPITIYRPTTNVDKSKMVVYFHGGGWTIASRKTHQTIVNTLADTTNTTWFSVEYRLAPEHKFPVWLDDCCEVTKHIIDNKELYGGDSNTKIGVCGDSAGGMIAASVCHSVKNIDFQILVYPATDMRGINNAALASYKEFTEPYHILTPEILKWYGNALRDEKDIVNPRASVLLQTSFTNVPPCLFIVAELDPIRDDSYEYQKVLEKNGIKTKLLLIKGAIHSFFSLPDKKQTDMSDDIVLFNISGEHFSINRLKLVDQSDYFRTLLNINVGIEKDKQDAITLREQDPKFFSLLMQYLNGDQSLTMSDLDKIVEEDDFYLIDSIHHLKTIDSSRKREIAGLNERVQTLKYDLRRCKIQPGTMVNIKSCDARPEIGDRVKENKDSSCRKWCQNQDDRDVKRGIIIGFSDGDTEIDIEWDDGTKDIGFQCGKKGNWHLQYD
ncbi:unnamed protein product [Didymodactylos carnosus]|uniref:BTB domain-containing protein n=2 Tax=Didymodactylos carnosus TaxID=1234261 RepID=A0A814VEV2_9BILA|nr:unnamed protein product [Didymodactylos carnosus]CAF3950647.1 unnamed protein product [Didymodactylos carnosus]